MKAPCTQLAIEQFEAALVLVPDILPDKAKLVLKFGDAPRARWLFEDILRADPNNVRAVEGLADLDRATPNFSTSLASAC